MSGIDPRQLLELAVRPALAAMGPDYSTPAAEQLVMGTAAVESGLVWLKQLGTGPALGLWQMEPFTHNDIARRAPQEIDYVLRNVLSVKGDRDPMEMAWNLRYGAAMCRMKYRDARPEIPELWDITGFEAYHKRYYNSALGETKPGEFVRAWTNLIAPQAERMWPE
jgi:hypothetical protein